MLASQVLGILVMRKIDKNTTNSTLTFVPSGSYSITLYFSFFLQIIFKLHVKILFKNFIWKAENECDRGRVSWSVSSHLLVHSPDHRHPAQTSLKQELGQSGSAVWVEGTQQPEPSSAASQGTYQKEAGSRKGAETATSHAGVPRGISSTTLSTCPQMKS